MKLDKRALVVKTRDVRIHAELWHSANCLLRAGQAEAKGSAHQFRASLIFRAFALEAFLNWIGQHRVPHWSYLERLKPREKLDLLNDLLGVTPDYSSRPWQIVKEIFVFRNFLAHGKPENLLAESMEDVDENLDPKLGTLIMTQWERFATEANAKRAQEDVREIGDLLYEKANIKHNGPCGAFVFGMHTHSASLST